MRLSRRALLAAPALAAPALARAQAWPDRPIRLIVPFGAGGAIDTLSRTVAARFADASGGQPLVVENRAGAGGTIAGAAVARERPDGLTLMMADIGANAIGRDLNPGLTYDPETAFTPIIHLVNLPLAVIAHPAVPHRSLADIIAAARARPGAYTYSSAGNGNGSHIFFEALLRQAGVQMVHVPYRSGAEMVTALVRADVQFGMPTVSSGLAMIRDGRARAVAVSLPEGVPLLPGIPPVSDTLPGYRSSVWHGIAGPAGMDAGLVARINEVFNRVAAMPEVQQAVAQNQAGSVVGGSPQQFAQFIAGEIARWRPVIREGNIRAD